MMNHEQVMRKALKILELISQATTEQFGESLEIVDELRAALAEPEPEKVAIVGTQEDTWKGYNGQWIPPGPPIKMIHMLRDLPEGTLLYANTGEQR